MGYADNFHELYWLRAIMGISEALYIPSALSLIADWHQGKSRSLAIGIHMTGLYVGQAIGGFGATVAAIFSWHSTFHWFGIIGIIYSLVLMIALRENPLHTSVEKIPVEEGKRPASLFSGLSVLFPPGPFGLFFSILQLRAFPVGQLRTGYLHCSLKAWIFRCPRLVRFQLSQLLFLHL